MTLLAAFQVLLSRYTGERDLLVGSPTAGRDAARTLRTRRLLRQPGRAARAAFGRADVRTPSSAQVRRTVLEAFAHQEYPFDLLVKRLQPERDAARSPIFQVMFTLAADAPAERRGAGRLRARRARARGCSLGELQLESLALEQRIAQFDLSVTAAEVGGGLTSGLRVQHRPLQGRHDSTDARALRDAAACRRRRAGTEPVRASAPDGSRAAAVARRVERRAGRAPRGPLRASTV